MTHYNLRTQFTLNALRECGNSSALPELNVLLAKVKTKLEEEGKKIEYIETYDGLGNRIAGWTSNDSNYRDIVNVIQWIEARAGKCPDV